MVRSPARRPAALSCAAIALASLGTLAGAGGDRAAVAAPARSIVDRADDLDRPQVHVIYAVPADGADRQLDLDGTLEASVARFTRWMRKATPGRSLRIDTFQGRTDISFYRSHRTGAELLAVGDQLSNTINADLPAAGFAEADKKYAVYYDGPSVATPCGGAAWPPNVPGQAAVMYLQSSCGTQTISTSADAAMGYWDVAMLHDLMHTLGLVPRCAPNHGGPARGHVTDDPSDLMWAGSGPWLPNGFESAVLDVGRDDYYKAPVDNCRDLDPSAYLTAPAATTTRTVGLVPVPLGVGTSASATFAFGPTFVSVSEVCFDLEIFGDPPGPDVVSLRVAKGPPLTGTPTVLPGPVPRRELSLCADAAGSPGVVAEFLDGKQAVSVTTTTGSVHVTSISARLEGVPSSTNGKTPQTYTAAGMLTPVTLATSAPKIGTFDLGPSRYAALDEVCFAFTFGADRFDPGEELRVELFGAGLAPLRAANVGPGSKAARERCVAASEVDHRARFAAAGQLTIVVTATTGSVSVQRLDVRVTGSRAP